MLARNTWVITLLASLVSVLVVFQIPFVHHWRDFLWQRVIGGVAYLGHIEAFPPASLEQRLNALLAENIRLHAELHDYRLLRQQLAAPAFTDFPTLPAAILGRPIDTFRSQVIINRGQRDGVKGGEAIVIQGSILIGFITETRERTAVATILLHPQTALAGETVPSDGQPVQGVVQGTHYTGLQLTTVPRDQQLLVGQAVVTSPRAGRIPHGLLMGTIREIVNEETAAYQHATLELPYDPDHLRAVTLLLTS